MSGICVPVWFCVTLGNTWTHHRASVPLLLLSGRLSHAWRPFCGLRQYENIHRQRVKNITYAKLSQFERLAINTSPPLNGDESARARLCGEKHRKSPDPSPHTSTSSPAPRGLLGLAAPFAAGGPEPKPVCIPRCKRKTCVNTFFFFFNFMCRESAQCSWRAPHQPDIVGHTAPNRGLKKQAGF